MRVDAPDPEALSRDRPEATRIVAVRVAAAREIEIDSARKRGIVAELRRLDLLFERGLRRIRNGVGERSGLTLAQQQDKKD